MPSYSRKVQIPGRTSQELYDKVSQDIEKFLSKAPIGKFEVDRDLEKKEVRVKGSVFSATLSCREAEMEVQAQLSLMVAPFKGKLDESLTQWLTKTFQLNKVS